jgi:hypothetical protein
MRVGRGGETRENYFLNEKNPVVGNADQMPFSHFLKGV